MTNDNVNNPKHYTSHPSGIECYEINQFMSGNLAAAFKYVWRAGLKISTIEDLEKAIWYLGTEKNLRKGLQMSRTATMPYVSQALKGKVSKVLKHEQGSKRAALAQIWSAHSNPIDISQLYKMPEPTSGT